MIIEKTNVRSALAPVAMAIMLAAAAGCTVSDTGPVTAGSPRPASVQELPDSIIGKWDVYPAIGPTSRGCTADFKASYSNGAKGSVNMFACNLVEGLGGINGVSRINAWERKGRTIILSGIAQPNIGTIDLPVDSFTDRVFGVTRDDVRFMMIRK